MRSVHSTIKRLSIPAIAVFGALTASNAVAQTEQHPGGVLNAFKNGPFSADFSTGFEFDSNVSVIEIDATSAQSDIAALFDFGIGVETELGEGTEIKLEYDFGQDIQFEISAFDTQTHRLSADFSHDFGEVEMGASYQFVHSSLGGAGFLRLHRVSPYAAAYVANKRVYLRGAFVYADKDFIGRLDRDSSSNAGSLDAFYFLNEQHTFVIAGYRFESDDAVAPEFDFNGHNLKFRFIQRIPFGKKDGKLRLGWRYENRNYKSITPSISAIRNDTRHRISASLEIPINKIMYAEIEARHDDFSSNLASADFTQNVVSFRIGGRI